MKSLNLITLDPWLAPYESVLTERNQYIQQKENQLTNNQTQSLSEIASGYLYFGLHATETGWVFREWAQIGRAHV